MAKSKYINVPDGYENEVNYFDSQPNKGVYVWELIRQDMKKKKEDEQIVDMVRNFLQFATSSSQFENIFNTNNNAKVSNNSKSTKDVSKKKSASSILG